MDHFARLGLTPQFRIDEADLDQRFRRLQAAVHPDRFATGSEVDRRLAVALAADGNEAYRVLRHPTRRAAYLCELRGTEVASQTHTAFDPGFLETQMHWRERLDDLKGLDEPARSAAVAAAGAELEAMIGAGRDRIAALIDDDADLEAAAAEVRELMFFDKLGETLEQLQSRPPAPMTAPMNRPPR